VLEAYIARAAYAQAKTNCLTEGTHDTTCATLMLAGCSNFYVFVAVVMLGPARQRAAELDAEFAATKKLRGPLHGVPVSD
jgi:Asp-tRNA(Asn)/Glu-tRNA(Gln) amidotransferase A subunit family amidase